MKSRAEIPGWQRGPVRFLDEKVEVIGHHRVGDDAKTEKGLQLAHEDHEMLPFRVSQDELPVNDPRKAVVVAEPFSPDACLSHDVPLIARMNSLCKLEFRR